MATNQTASLQMTNLRKPVLRALAPLRLPEPLALKMLCGQTARMQKKNDTEIAKNSLASRSFSVTKCQHLAKARLFVQLSIFCCVLEYFRDYCQFCTLARQICSLGKRLLNFRAQTIQETKKRFAKPPYRRAVRIRAARAFPHKGGIQTQKSVSLYFQGGKFRKHKRHSSEHLALWGKPLVEEKEPFSVFSGSADTQRDKRDTRSLFFQDIIYNSIQNSVHNFSKGVRAYPPQFAPLAPDILTRFLQTYAQRFRRSPEPVPESPDQRVTEPRGQISQTLPQGQLVIKIETENGLNSRVAVLDGSDLNIGLVTL